MNRSKAVLAAGGCTAAVALLTGPAVAGIAQAHKKPPMGLQCPSGYRSGEVRIYGQRQEAGINPVTHNTIPVIVQNDWDDPTDHTHYYVPVLACWRDRTNEENNELYWWGVNHP